MHSCIYHVTALFLYGGTDTHASVHTHGVSDICHVTRSKIKRHKTHIHRIYVEWCGKQHVHTNKQSGTHTKTTHVRERWKTETWQGTYIHSGRHFRRSGSHTNVHALHKCFRTHAHKHVTHTSGFNPMPVHTRLLAVSVARRVIHRTNKVALFAHTIYTQIHVVTLSQVRALSIHTHTHIFTDTQIHTCWVHTQERWLAHATCT